MKIDRTMVVIKVIVLVIIRLIYDSTIGVVNSILIQPLTNELAMQQMYNTTYSSAGLQIYAYVTGHIWVVFLLLALIVFKEEIFAIINLLKGEESDEEN